MALRPTRAARLERRGTRPTLFGEPLDVLGELADLILQRHHVLLALLLGGALPAQVADQRVPLGLFVLGAGQVRVELAPFAVESIALADKKKRKKEKENEIHQAPSWSSPNRTFG